jgi:polyhydroxybutyrate depolymerase
MNALLVSLLMTVLGTDPLGSGDHARTLKVGDLNRNYLVHVPAKYNSKTPIPVVLSFHGGGANAEGMVKFCGLNDKAEEAGFLVVYPSGTGRLNLLTFNGGNCCGYAMNNNVDDVGFVRAILDDLAKVANIDAKRVFATGMSNGGIMSYRLASELSDRIAAIAPVGGPMGMETCSPTRPVPVIHFHGTDDEYAPFKGGKGSRSIGVTHFYSVEHSIQVWVKANGCPEKPVVTQLPDKADDGMTVIKKTYGPGQDGAEVVLIEIEGGGHTWPGQEPKVKFLGKSTKDISANDLMWEFFQRHPMR